MSLQQTIPQLVCPKSNENVQINGQKCNKNEDCASKSQICCETKNSGKLCSG